MEKLCAILHYYRHQQLLCFLQFFHSKSNFLYFKKANLIFCCCSFLTDFCIDSIKSSRHRFDLFQIKFLQILFFATKKSKNRRLFYCGRDQRSKRSKKDNEVSISSTFFARIFCTNFLPKPKRN